MAELRHTIGDDAFRRSLPRSAAHAALSIGLTVATAVIAWRVIPMELAWMPAWILYAIVAGTFACGIWIIAHECGHGAFCDNDPLQNAIGFALHSALLVPYFSWQRSHAVHHAKTNHIDDGETHVPHRLATPSGARLVRARRGMGAGPFAVWTIISRLLVGWPMYLVAGLTGGPSRGRTNHFWPYRPFSSSLFPARWHRRVLASAVGVTVMGIVLVAWGLAAGSPWPVIALYGGPWLVANAWLVAYTWLQHTSADVDHYGGDEWSYVRGAFCSIDRPYGRFFDLVHHRIGSTHVAHHLFPMIPHYNAKAATDALAARYPKLYRYDPTPVPVAMWRAARDCVVVDATSTQPDVWSFTHAETDPRR